ncbi:heme A synthase [Micrococcus sp. FDAARGOS_333]|uniref:COX15/CtaA family protein n=1 Tax=Micrococcus sp. FDAARGOS_333 TaxID=1930558 RepID=UPI001D1024E8|nr:COX15/CtaA family protein [Micrococcus sp. FDAARGOS_333]
MTVTDRPAAPLHGAGLASGPDWLPSAITKSTVVLAVANLVANMGIVLTGGAVRLTGSGLGCPTWPKCTPESLVNTAEMGIHGVIEFGNRTLTGVLGILALLLVAWVWRLRQSHREVFLLSVGILAGVVFQAVLGGITVLTRLNPWIVGGHFIVSGIMIAIAAMLCQRVRDEHRHGAGYALVDGTTTSATRRGAWAILALSVLMVVLGTVVTGTGPHSGDPDAVRHGFDALVVTRFHALPVYPLVFACVVTAVLVLKTAGASQAQRTTILMVLGVIVYQGAVGYWQHLTGLPEGVVILHLLGSVLTIGAVVSFWQRQTSRYVTPGAPLA